MTTKRIILLLIVLTLASLAIYARASAADPLITDDVVVWDLTKTVVVDPGQTVSIPADKKTGFPGGTLTSGYVLEAKAKTKSGKLIPEGTFRLTMSVFSPAADFGEQKAGLWYVVGQWTVVDKKADEDPEAKKSRHNKYKAEGRIQAELPFNPLERPVGWSAKAAVPMSLAAGQWARGSKGVLTLNAQLEGDLYLALTLWPQMP